MKNYFFLFTFLFSLSFLIGFSKPSEEDLKILRFCQDTLRNEQHLDSIIQFLGFKMVDTLNVFENYMCDKIPSFGEGESDHNINSFISKNISYPRLALENNVQGNVIINFIIDENGNICNPKIIRSVGFGIDEEALRLLKLLPAWNPAIKNGKAVKTHFTLPIHFKLS